MSYSFYIQNIKNEREFVMEKNIIKKIEIIAMLAVFCAFIITGCTFANGGTSPVYYGYNVQNIDHCGFFYISKTTYYGNRVEFDVNSRYDLNEMDFSTPDDANATVDINNNTVILYSDIPNDITSLEVSNVWFEVSFRYLNTSEYACIWRTWADDIGMGEYEGNKDKYYTEEEKEQQREAAEKAEELRKQAEKEDRELFEIFQGRWMSEDGDYFDIYDAGTIRKTYTGCSITKGNGPMLAYVLISNTTEEIRSCIWEKSLPESGKKRK